MYAKVIARSISRVTNLEVCSWELELPRFFWSEVLTHRQASRNASSSRAIRSKVLLKNISENPGMPVFWGGEKPGMQAAGEINELVRNPITGEMMTREEAWIAAARAQVEWSREFAEAGYHKQLSNRICENMGHIRAVFTLSNMDHFFKLRIHKDAQPEFDSLARMMQQARQEYAAKDLGPGEWHMPYADDAETLAETRDFMEKIGLAENYFDTTRRMVSAARCARVSYKTFFGKTSTVYDDFALCKKLFKGGEESDDPNHMSPFEHQVKSDSKRTVTVIEHNDDCGIDLGIREEWRNPDLHGNLVGFIQSRKLFEKFPETFFEVGDLV